MLNSFAFVYSIIKCLRIKTFIGANISLAATTNLSLFVNLLLSFFSPKVLLTISAMLLLKVYLVEIFLIIIF